MQGAQALGVWDRRGRVARLRPKRGEPKLTRASVKPATEAASGAAPPRPLHAMLPLAHGGDRVKTLSACSPWPSRAAAWAARPATPTLFLPGAFVPKPQNTPPGRWGGPITPELCPWLCLDPSRLLDRGTGQWSPPGVDGRSLLRAQGLLVSPRGPGQRGTQKPESGSPACPPLASSL